MKEGRVTLLFSCDHSNTMRCGAVLIVTTNIERNHIKVFNIMYIPCHIRNNTTCCRVGNLICCVINDLIIKSKNIMSTVLNILNLA